ncbi:MAG: LON peptidase substrate-binding domain-containing protein [Desulfobacterales bacterium]|jgi:Lon protease-like protein
MHHETVIPIFPLGLVLLPQMSLPLHIFEERYKLMTRMCIEQRKEFGIVYFNGKQFETIGCTARIEKILKRYDDGRLDIITRGANRFAIKELLDEKPYLQAKIGYFDDHPQEKRDKEALQKLADSGLELLKKINPLTQQYNEDQLTNQPDTKSVSFLIAACDGFSLEEKQRFLEMTSTPKRLRKAVEALETLFERLSITRKIERIIGGNGNLPKSL